MSSEYNGIVQARRLLHIALQPCARQHRQRHGDSFCRLKRSSVPQFWSFVPEMLEFYIEVASQGANGAVAIKCTSSTTVVSLCCNSLYLPSFLSTLPAFGPVLLQGDLLTTCDKAITLWKQEVNCNQDMCFSLSEASLESNNRYYDRKGNKSSVKHCKHR